jgi:RNA polymerase sigma factor (TIGR02999 family)
MAEPANSANIPELLQALNAGQAGARERLASAIHDDLRAMAHRHLARDFGPHMAGVTIQPTVLANDTLMRLIRQRQRYDNAGHVFAIASRLMMRTLLDYHRERKALKRGGGAIQVSLDPERHEAPASAGEPDIEALDAVLEKLAALDARKADVVRYRVLWGLTVDEVAQTLGISRASIERDWAFAKAWLAKELSTSR